jgi:hypothetical protein
VTFDRARAVADAIMYEGYALYPYRPSSLKNVARWQFGVLAPRAVADDGGCDPWWMETQCLVEGDEVQIQGRLRFLHACRSAGSSWDQGEACEVDFEASLQKEGAHAIPFERGPIAGFIRVAAQRLDGPVPLRRVSVRVENVTHWEGASAREDTILSSLLGAHLLLYTARGAFVSLIEPPAWAEDAAERCKNTRVFPVLAGERGDRTLVLASPIILYDHPEIAPESPQDLFDATEIDEILTLRTRTLTDDEKREARAVDPRIAALIDRADSLGEGDLLRMHGTFRPTDRSAVFAPGDRVRLRPGRHRTDAQDMFLEGMHATVRAVMRDVDDRECIAVTIDEDPAAELHSWHGRFHYFKLDEVERIVTSS